MKFISFSSALSNSGLDQKVNNFLNTHPNIEIIEIKYAASFGSVFAAILYR